MDDLILSRDYRSLWKAAKNKNTLEALEEVFDALANEVGAFDPERERISESAAKSAAERKNAMETGEIKRRP